MSEESGSPSPPGPIAPSGDQADTSRTERIDVLAAYFRTNAAGYTSEALRNAAADAGYEAREIDAAWAVSAEPAPIQHAASMVPALVVIGYTVSTYAVAGILATIPQTSGLAVPAVGAAFVLGIYGWLVLRDSRPDLANALKIAVIIAILVPLVLFLVALGICLAILGGLGYGA